ncbi:MAG: DNA polymerase-3 subunit delta [Oceanospirillaceae bacterium]|jgi:DNA polymerase-3 subunit delta
MKIKADQLSALLQKSTAQTYLINGDEPLILEESCDLVRQHLKSKGFDEREVLHVEAGFKWEYLLECANALSLFAENRLIELRLGSQKINKAASKILQEYLQYAPAENTLLIIADKLDAASKKSAWYKSIEQNGTIVEIWPVEIQQLPAWIKNRASAQNIQLDDDAVNILCERIEGNLLAAKQEIDKLQLLKSNSPLSADDIIDAVSDSSRYDVFALVDAFLAGQSGRSLKILQTLQQEGVEATIILWAISRELRLIHAVKTGLNQSVSYESLCGKLRIWGKKKQFLKQAASRLDFTDLEGLLRQSSSADQIIKGMSSGNHWLIITDILLILSGKRLKLPPSDLS